MKKVTFILVAALAVMTAGGERVAAQDKAAEVIAKMREAIGGGKLDALKTFSLTAKSARNMGERQMISDLELYFDLPDRYLRVENITAPIARTMQSGFNGEKVIRPAGSGAPGAPMMIMNGVPMAAAGGGGGQRVVMEVAAGGGGTRGGGSGGGPMTPEQQAMMDASMIRSQRVELSRMMLGWFGTAHPGLKATYSYAGEAESPDGKAHIINVKADGGFDVKLFVDQASNMPLMVSYEAPEPIRMPRPAPGETPPTTEEMQKRVQEAMKNRKMIEHRVYFADWKDADGIQFPHTLQRATGGETTEEWTISKVKVNPKIDAKKFQ